jgi:4'-phosphopantetheinyl transferase EntD
VSSHTVPGASGSVPSAGPTDSPLIESLCPAGVVAAELRGAGDPESLDPEEARSIARAVAKRVREFAAGRQCAHRALERLGVPAAPLRAAPDRRPLWPAGVVGSITHTEEFCAAAVALSERVAALGIDTERASAVHAELRPSICTPGELSWIDGLPAAERGPAAALIFCAKEAFYKCQYPASLEWVGFQDLEVHAEDWGAGTGASTGRLTLEARRPLSFFAGGTAPALHAAYRFHEDFVSVAVARLTP